MRGERAADLRIGYRVSDFGVFQACFNGPNHPARRPAKCDAADLDGDRDVDAADFGVFQDCFNGPNRPPRG